MTAGMCCGSSRSVQSAYSCQQAVESTIPSVTRSPVFTNRFQLHHMRIKFIWEGSNGTVTIRVEQASNWGSKRRSLLVNGQLVASDDSSLGMARLVGETDSAHGHKDVVANVNNGAWRDSCTVTFDGREVPMRLLLGPLLSFVPVWSRLLFGAFLVCWALFSDDFIGVKWIEWLVLLACLVLMMIASNVTIARPTAARTET